MRHVNCKERTSIFRGMWLRMGLRGVTLLCLWLLCGGVASTSAQTCDPQLTPIDNLILQYREREDLSNRCEGFYQSRVAAGAIDVVGVIQGNFHFEWNEQEILEITSPIIDNTLVNIRAVGIPIKTYYRMDAPLGPKHTLIWPLKAVIYPAKLLDRHIGVFGWTGEGMDTAYIPVVAAAQLGSTTNDGKIRVFVRATVDVGNVQWRTAEVTGAACAEFTAWNTLSPSSYQSGQTIEILLPPSQANAVCLEVAAQNQQNATWLKKSLRILIGK